MKKYFYMAVAAIAVLSSCSSDNDFKQNPIGKGGLIFTATMEISEGTRATYDTTNKCAAWEVSDQISINGQTYVAKTAGITTTFMAEGKDATGETYNAYFPASLFNGTTAKLPAIQNYETGKFNMPMYASSTTTELQFYNLCAVLAIKVTSADIATLKSIKVASDKKMNGSFIVTDNKAVMGEDGTNVVVLESPEALTLTEKGTVFYIAIPAQEYKYLNIFLSADGETYTQAMATKKATGIGTIARSMIYDIDYKKNATKLWAGNLFFADCNVGANSATEYGGYYAWGGSLNKGDGHNTGSEVLTGDNDTATKLWGSNWRMPTADELGKQDEHTHNYITGLLGKCTVKWKDGKYEKYNDTDAKGRLCTGTGDYATNSIFLPAAGNYEKGYFDSNNKNNGYYWSSMPAPLGTTQAYLLNFGPDYSAAGYTYRYYGYSVRAVLEEK